MVELLKPDFCIIGAGAGGLDVAAGAAAAGKSVVLVEKDKFGGARLKTAVPSKALVAAARVVRCIADAPALGLIVPLPEIDFGMVQKYFNSVIGALTAESAKERFTGLGVRVIEGAAQFTNRRRFVVGGTIEIKARRYVIATGSLPMLPDIPGLADVSYLTSETIFDLANLPERLIVIGAGSVGLEFAQAFRRLGAEVTVLDSGEPLAQEDRECARIVLDALAREGVSVRGGVAIERIARMANGVQVVLGGVHGAVEGTHLLVACGRRANVDGLALDRARVKHGPGGVIVNPALRTSNRRIYAVGDVTGAPPFVHVARHHAGLVLQNALSVHLARMKAGALPRVIFTDPELAHVGLTDAEALRRRRGFRVLRWPYSENDRARIERTSEGHIKIVTSRRGRVLGATIVGAGASELIAAWSLAVNGGFDIRALSGTILPYPTIGDVGKRAATTYLTQTFERTWARRILSFLRR